MTEPIKGTNPRRAVHSPWRLAVLGTSVLVLVGIVAWSSLGAQSASSAAASDEITQPQLVPAIAPPAASTLVPRPVQPFEAEAFVVAARDGGRSHIWAQLPGESKPYQLTSGSWDDRDPAVSPLRDTMAFASSRDGDWDLYLLDLVDQSIQRLTSTTGYEGSPTWSPDGRWLAFEAYYKGDFDIWILPVDGSQAPVQLTDDPAADFSPAWDPGGRRIAFVSDRAGLADIYLADLDHPNDRFRNLTQTTDLAEGEPIFSPDGSELAYTVQSDGVRGIQRMSLVGSSAPHWVGQGVHPSWSAGGSAISAVMQTPYDDYIVSYALEGAAPPNGGTISGNISELHWSLLPISPSDSDVVETALPLYQAVIERPKVDDDRIALVPLESVRPAGLMLSDAANEAFDALRARAAGETGWDVLGNLQHAFVGINDPLPPGYAYNDWLYTGRAFSVSLAAVQAGWVEIVREDYGQETYWRVFVRTLAQDGSQGVPLRQRPWDFSARFAGDATLYDAGGAPKAEIPDGYYLDFTTLAADYGFDRLPALSNWRSFYPGARYDEFALRASMDWTSAMAELYPASAIATPKPYQTPTPTPSNTPRPTPTPWWLRWITPTVVPPTPTLTGTPSSTGSP